MIQSLGAALLGWPLAISASETRHARRKLLFFSRSVLFEHSVVRRDGSGLSFAERQLIEIVKPLGCDVACTKNGSVFEKDLDAYAAILSYSCGRRGDLMKAESLDRSPPLTERGWKNLDRAVRAGKPVLAIHPGAWLLPEAFGADCLGHGSQQVGKMVVASPRFPGTKGLGESFSLKEEWFSLVEFAKDLHVILVQDCAGMDKKSESDRRCYDRPPFPGTWARMHEKGRVFYTSLGHREDVWTSKPFRQILVGGLCWALGDVQADITPNCAQVAPRANEYAK
jgi:type 1 glutamine amidotransferase